MYEMHKHYPNFASCSLQTFPDNKNQKEDKTLNKIMDTSDLSIDRCKTLNNKGAGIFFSVNSMQRGKRDIASITGINAWICEIDGLEKEAQQRLIKISPIKPSMIIESKASYHLYWFASDGTITNRKRICNGLRNFFDGDPQVVDVARVLRLPGYYHKKDPSDPFMIKTIYVSDKKRTEKEMLEAFPDTTSFTELKQKAQEKHNVFRSHCGTDNFRERVKAMDCKAMLREISGTTLVGGESFDFKRNSSGTEQILCNGKLTGCWIDTSGKIGSKNGGGPNRTNRVFRYGRCDGKELHERIKHKHPEMLESKHIIVPRVETKSVALTFSRGLQSIDKALGMPATGDFVLLAGFPSVGKTEFMYFVARENSKKTKACYFALELPGETMKRRLARSYAGITKYNFQIGNYTESQKMQMNDYYDFLNSFDDLEFLSYESSPKIEDIVKTIQEKAKQGCNLFFVDNIGNIAGTSDEIQRLAEVSKVLRMVVNNLQVCVFGLHHMSKPKGQEVYKPGGLGKIRGTQKLIDDATIVAEIYRDLDPDNDDPQSRAEVILKQYKDTTGGVTGTVDFFFQEGNYAEEYKK